MRITLGCKRWSRGHQYGFRIYVPDIQRLGAMLVAHPSSDSNWSSFEAFRQEVIAGNYPPAYSRAATISNGSKSINVTVTYAHHGRTFQGYVTAHINTWLMNYVRNRMDTDLKCEYLVRDDRDFILIPSRPNVSSVYVELDKKDKMGRKRVRKIVNRRSHGHFPADKALEIGLYFEDRELEKLKAEFPSPPYQVIHRYPSVDSNVPLLYENNVSCDIDIVTNAGQVVKCVEVKSVSMDDEAPFELSIRQWNSRVWCRRHRIPYEIAVYHHFRYQAIRRAVVAPGDKLKRRPSGYYCIPA